MPQRVEHYKGAAPDSHWQQVLAFRRGARVVEWDGLENRCAGNRTVGSNPTLSANITIIILIYKRF